MKAAFALILVLLSEAELFQYFENSLVFRNEFSTFTCAFERTAVFDKPELLHFSEVPPHPVGGKVNFVLNPRNPGNAFPFLADD